MMQTNWSVNSAKSSARRLLRADILSTPHLTRARFSNPGDVKDAQELIHQLSERLGSTDPFCLLLDAPGATWSEDAAEYFYGWWTTHCERLECQAVALVVPVSRRSRWVVELALSRELAVPCRCFRCPEKAAGWARAFAERSVV